MTGTLKMYYSLTVESLTLSLSVSLVVIVFELTGALSHVLPIMISVMVAKWVGDAISQEGIYAAWIAMRQYPWLPPGEYRDKGQTAAQIMKPVEKLVVVEDGMKSTLKDLDMLLSKHSFHGFPVVRGDEFVGFVVRDRAKVHLGSYDFVHLPRMLIYLH